MKFSTKGSLWHRWDPHLHAPGTLLNDQFSGDWTKYLSMIENSDPPIRVLGVTDYFCIETYREVRRLREGGRLSQIELLFPNVEMRLDIKTAKTRPVNIHLLFSPEDPNHEEEIIRLLGHLDFTFNDREYRCTLNELIAFGRAFDPTQIDDKGALRTGATQFKVTLAALQKLFKQNVWLRRNCLVAVAGSSTDGTAGLQLDDSFAALRREIERFSQVIFAATPRQREFWLGKLPKFDQKFIETNYGALKPCLNGSDAHSVDVVAGPAPDRHTWLKGDLTFETLRQAVIEPEGRVWIGPSPPPGPMKSQTIEAVTVSDAPWLVSHKVDFNPGLVTIIGARGSGKTALVDLVAAGAGALHSSIGASSFLRRASVPADLLGTSQATLQWADNTESQPATLIAAVRRNQETLYSSEVCYLSQQFVEQLCSDGGLGIALRREMERVVFESMPQTERLEADGFDALAETLLEPIRSRREELRRSVSDIGQRVIHEDSLRELAPVLDKQAEQGRKEIAASRRELEALLPKDRDQRSARLMALETSCTAAEGVIEKLTRRLRSIEDLEADVDLTRKSREPQRFRELQQRFGTAGLGPSDWQAFALSFSGDVDLILRNKKDAVKQLIAFATNGDPQKPLDRSQTPQKDWPLRALLADRDQLKKEVGIDADRQNKYNNLHKNLGLKETSLRRLEQDILHAKGALERRNGLVTDRRRLYTEIFETFAAEEEVLANLYKPLSQSLQDSEGALAKLAFTVQRKVDLPTWVAQGEALFDLRKDSTFRGRGSLAKEAGERLLQAWSKGTAHEVDTAMDSFRLEFTADIMKARPASIEAEHHAAWGQSVADWLYGTEHVTVEYSIQYDGVAIEQLSPGTRGIVLLLLYLAVDQNDLRPLLIDQPEENLDPHSVFNELVPHFRSARKRRQIIIVTHNANLVVNTDADQVIVASSRQVRGQRLPNISYRCGSIENPEIRNDVCRLLEGGERAFVERERRYRIRWGEVLSAQAPEEGEDSQVDDRAMRG
ncbi:MAG: AAA family ATPase [Bryobacterales bacterium]|nr:AAA family ATPase [Bryobacterales bacterium]